MSFCPSICPSSILHQVVGNDAVEGLEISQKSLEGQIDLSLLRPHSTRNPGTKKAPPQAAKGLFLGAGPYKKGDSGQIEVSMTGWLSIDDIQQEGQKGQIDLSLQNPPE
jgi:hypothetical protein